MIVPTKPIFPFTKVELSESEQKAVDRLVIDQLIENNPELCEKELKLLFDSQ